MRNLVSIIRVGNQRDVISPGRFNLENTNFCKLVCACAWKKSCPCLLCSMCSHLPPWQTHTPVLCLQWGHSHSLILCQFVFCVLCFSSWTTFLFLNFYSLGLRGLCFFMSFWTVFLILPLLFNLTCPPVSCFYTSVPCSTPDNFTENCNRKLTH